ncbi:MAG: hypothetical protein LJE61_10365 [Thiocapsa sp.]|jgi:hypothetical protein|nr:hypothetical protein [Thiocapsa sp.]MCG6898231.1 hypothetical protein [Thiocapsa sp.]MCG6985582.1 hypothetical protein [Thiocapsa sp.]
MAEERFDLSYAGGIAPGADPATVRARLTAVFKLDEQGMDRLFTGRPVIVKRGADAATKARFEQAFAHAGAVLRITPVELAENEGGAQSARGAAPLPDAAQGEHTAGTPRLSLTTHDGYLEEPRAVNIAAFDTGSLSLVSGHDWDLADCAAPPAPVAIPDIGHLSLTGGEPPSDPDELAD